MSPYFLSFLGTSAIFSSFLFIPLLAKELGANLFQVGLAPFSFGTGAFISYYLFGRLSDIKGMRKPFIILGGFLSFIIYFLHIFIHTLPLLFVIRSLAGFSMGIYSFPLMLVASLRGSQKKGISKINAFSSLGTLVGWLTAGILLEYNRIFLFSSFIFLVFTLSSLKLKDIKLPELHIPLFPWKIIRKNWRIYLSFFMRHAGASSVWAIFPIYLKGLGANKFAISLIYSLNPLIQFLSLLWITKMTDKLNPGRMISAGLLLSSTTFFIYAVMPDYHWGFLAAVVLGTSWATLYTGSLLYLSSKNIEKGTSTGIFGSAYSLSIMIGPFLGGSISYFLSMKACLIFASLLPLLAYIFIAPKRAFKGE